MILEKFANAFWTTLTAELTATATTIAVAVAAPTALQGGRFRAVIGSEIVLVTSGQETTTWTVTRGVEGTTAAAHGARSWVAHFLTAAGLLNSTGVFDARAYGASPSASAAVNTAAIELASLDAAVDHGTIQLPPGTLLVSWFENPDTADAWACIILRDGCSLRGAGIGATTIKLADSQASHSSANMVTNHTPAGGDENITVADFTVDGNGENQTTLYNGVAFYAARNVRHERVRALNVRGTANFPPGETFGIVATSCADVSYVTCEAMGTAGTHGTGFSSNLCTNVTRVNCTAYGMSEGMGFSDWTSRGVHNIHCIAQRNGSNGFNLEVSNEVFYVGCRAGGRAAAGASNYPHGANADLGNIGSGLTINESTDVIIDDCISTYNGNNGIDIINSSAARLATSIFGNNTNEGVYIDATSIPLSYIAPSVSTPGNAYDFAMGALGYVNGTHLLAAPAIPAATVTTTNPWPFDVVVYAVGSWAYMEIDGAGPGMVGSGMFHLKSGSTIAFWTAPSAWTWWRS